jgi:hypothetical protein
VATNSDGAPDANQQATARRVQRALTEMHELRQQFQAERQSGQIDRRTRLKLQAAVIAVHDEIRPYRRRADELWREPLPSARRELEAMDEETQEGLDPDEYPDWSFGLDELSRHLQPERQQQRVSAGMGRARVETSTRPTHLPAAELIEVSYRIDEVAREMGFSPAPDRKTRDIDGGII